MAVTFAQKTEPSIRAISVLKDLLSRPSGAIGLSLVLFHVVLALVSPYIIPFDWAKKIAGLRKLSVWRPTIDYLFWHVLNARVMTLDNNRLVITY